MPEPTHIRVRNARTHNLKGVDVDVPRHALVVFTGVSGSGKSSLAYDTIFKEGQRRFIESLSSYARQFLGDLDRPPVDSVEGVSPTLSIDQKTVNRNPRSTVGTVTEIWDHLRLLMARLGTPRCPECGRTVAKSSVTQIVDRLLSELAGERVLVLGPAVRERKGEHRKEMEQLHRDGWVRARIDGAMVELSEPPALARYEKHTIEVVVDRLRIDVGDRARLHEAVDTAARIGSGSLTVVRADAVSPTERPAERPKEAARPRGKRASRAEPTDVPEQGEPASAELSFSIQRACPEHPEVAIPEFEPRLFSFNAPQGACTGCNGLGAIERFDEALLFDMDATIPDAFRAFNEDGKLPFALFDRDALREITGLLGADASEPLGRWPEEMRHRLVRGDPEVVWSTSVDRGERSEVRERAWRGLLPMVETVWQYTSWPTLERFRVRSDCAGCRGERLNPVARAVTFRGKRLPELSQMSVESAYAFFGDIALAGAERDIGEQLLHEIRGRLAFLHEVGLGYLSLDRSAATLSGGESQRIRLAAQVGSALGGVTYVLDEPSIGLHARDNRRLLGALRRLRDRGNSVLVVEHDPETILAADFVVDVGPGAGRGGGEIVAAATPQALFSHKSSPTAAWLRGEKRIELPEKRREPAGTLTLTGARVNNLRGVDLVLPLGVLVVVTGVSGSGKSSLVFDVLEPSVRERKPVCCERISGLEQLDKLVEISQSPIGRTPRSNPATYTGLFDTIRDLFASVPESKARGYKKGRFSFNVAGGRCEACQGAGVRLVEMQFLPPVEVECEVCAGRRFNAETLEVTWKGLTIKDVLALTVEEANAVFGAVPKVARVLSTLSAVGLGYVPLGQPSTTLSGGEAQRIKLATELQRPATGKTLYLLDEPTTGLHFDDVRMLIAALQRLVDGGNSVLVVEHHTDVIKVADRIIDLGPEGGQGGGQIVALGTPEQLAKADTPTGRVLHEMPEFAPKRARKKTAPLLAAEASPAYTAGQDRPDALVVRGARMHNLRDITVSIPHNKMTVITGVSGSGKTSLAFDTIFAEGQRQYVESLSTYARRFLGRLERAPVDKMEGLQPAIAIDQRAAGHNPRSTVATVTEIHDVLRLLYARIGAVHCPTCALPVRAMPPAEAAASLREKALSAGYLLAKLRPAPDGRVRRDSLAHDGWTRLYSRDREVELSDDASIVLLQEGADLVVDRFAPAKVPLARVSEAIERAYDLADGRARFVPRDEISAAVGLSMRAQCEAHGVVIEGELTPRHFSFNAKLGACTRCDGVGITAAIVSSRLLPEPEKGLWDALDPRVSSVLARSARNRSLLEAVLSGFGVKPEDPVSSWPDAARTALLEGQSEPVTVRWSKSWGSSVRTVEESRPWPGLLAVIDGWQSRLPWLVAETTCPRCLGGRLRPELLAVTIAGRSIAEMCAMPVADALSAVCAWNLQGAAAIIAQRPIEELRKRMRFLCDVGLGYLSLDRSASTLSGGESQRIRLASQLGAGLCAVTYVLDEPTVGLHARDTERLVHTLEGLRDAGNTVLLVEHDPDTINRADHVIDLGPGAGMYGGSVLAVGTPAELKDDPASLTGRWLAGIESLPARPMRRTPRSHMTVRAPKGHNLRCGDVSFPTGVWVAVSGVSGSGKSTLVMDTLAPALAAHTGAEVFASPHGGLILGERVDRVVVVDQDPIGRTPRSTPATYTGLLDPLRTLFASIPGAKERGWLPGRFSFNAAGGRCNVCEGRGAMLVEMHFLPDVWVTCEACSGKRYDPETLTVRWQGRSIADVLAMRADEALELFRNHKRLSKSISALCDVGLGYLTLGQPATTLSGGEAQRVKLASELSSRKGHAVYILDEPTTGLHLADVAKLVTVLHRLVDDGHTVITIEHHLGMLAQADYLLDLGPEGGGQGGQVVAKGTPEEVASTETATGLALRRELAQSPAPAKKAPKKRTPAQRHTDSP